MESVPRVGPDPERDHRQRAANLSRRAKLLRYHATRRGTDGKSVAAQRGGYARMGDDPALARAIGTEMALRRWYPKEKSHRRDNGTGDGTTPQEEQSRGNPDDTS